MAQTQSSVAVPYIVDLQSCDREPIHQIGAVQPIGFLIALTRDWRISRVSSNTPAHLGQALDSLLGAPLDSVLIAKAMHAIRNRLAMLHGPDAVERAFAVQLQDGGPSYDLAIHMSGPTIIIEAEPNVVAGDLNAGAMVRSMLARLQGRTSLLQEAARLVSALTGFDRVMIYRFHPDGSGEVVAERVRSGLEPFLGLHYPAEDIPLQARALLVRNPVRILVDVAAEPSLLISAPDSPDGPLDLSMSTLRAHSTMCIEFLANMGVGATMTVSLVRDGKLWGLISCHHMAPRHVGFEQRTTAELFGQMLSFLIEKQEREEVAAYVAHMLLRRQQLVAAVVERGSANESVAELADRMADLVPCDGVAVLVDGRLTLNGETPTVAECLALQKFLNLNMQGQIYATDALGRDFPPAQGFVDRAAGLLVLPISRLPGDYLMFFRHELAHSIKWAGQPGKLVVHGPSGPRLTPRKSFEAWRETVRGHSAAWTSAELSAAEMMRTTLLELVLHRAGLTEIESRAAAQKQELLIAELNHRVRNILGLIRGLVSQSRASASDIDTFAEVLGNRVHALARAHDQITAKNWGPNSLAALIGVEADAFLGTTASRVVFSGPMVMLQPQAFSTIVLVVHELMTNAAKHGALANGKGTITIDWSFDADGDLILDWRESGGPTIVAPTRRGFGSTIIERSIPHELGGKAVVDYAPSGLHARFVVPARFANPEIEATAVATTADMARSSGRLSGSVLLVEDNLVLALDAEDILLDLGATSVLVASNVTAALAFLATETPSFALLDINLGSERSWPIATRLRELGIRYVFATGYGDGIEYPLEHRSAASIAKPYTRDSIANVLGNYG